MSVCIQRELWIAFWSLLGWEPELHFHIHFCSKFRCQLAASWLLSHKHRHILSFSSAIDGWNDKIIFIFLVIISPLLYSFLYIGWRWSQLWCSLCVCTKHCLSSSAAAATIDFCLFYFSIFLLCSFFPLIAISVCLTLSCLTLAALDVFLSFFSFFADRQIHFFFYLASLVLIVPHTHRQYLQALMMSFSGNSWENKAWHEANIGKKSRKNSQAKSPTTLLAAAHFVQDENEKWRLNLNCRSDDFFKKRKVLLHSARWDQQQQQHWCSHIGLMGTTEGAQ